MQNVEKPRQEHVYNSQIREAKCIIVKEELKKHRGQD